jgi:hypothetical protein
MHGYIDNTFPELQAFVATRLVNKTALVLVPSPFQGGLYSNFTTHSLHTLIKNVVLGE